MRTLIDKCLYNWLGYGNPNSKYWFIGTEEGGAEIWRNETVSLKESLLIRSKFELAMDQQVVWGDYYNIPISSFKGATVWRFISAFMIALEGINPGENKDKVKAFMDNELGALNGNLFLCELFPLPKRKKGSIEPYESIWKSEKEYHSEVKEKRFSLIKDTLEKNSNVSLIISYEKGLTETFLKQYYDGIESSKTFLFGKNQRFELHEIKLSDKRKILFLKTPFFGQGQISYDGIWNISKELI